MYDGPGRLKFSIALLIALSLSLAACGAPAATPTGAALAPMAVPGTQGAATPGAAAVPETTLSPTATLPLAATAAATALSLPTEAAAPASPAAAGTAAATPGRAASPTPGPAVLAFQVVPTVTLNAGDELAMSWQATGERAEICPIGPTGPVEGRCRAVPISGSTTWTAGEEDMGYTGFALRAWLGSTNALQVVDVKLQCQNLRRWFFPDPPRNCPAAAAVISEAAGQVFEHGLMVWTAEPDTFYVFYEGEDAAGFQTFDWVTDPRPALKPGASPDNRVGETPPAGLLEPVSGFGMVWRGEVNGVRPDVRQRLGWATGPELAFESAYQCMTVAMMHYWVCFLRGPRGEILRLHPDSTAQVRFVWQEW